MLVNWWEAGLVRLTRRAAFKPLARINTKLAIALALALFPGPVTAWGQEVPIAFVKVADVNRLLKDATLLLLVDVRNRQEYLARHIKGAVSIPLATIEEHSQEIPKQRLVVLY